MTCAATSEFFELLSGNYRRLLGQAPPFLDGLSDLSADAPRWLYEDAPACVLAHDTTDDPRFIYANRSAQDLFEYSWDEIVALPSRLSAEAPNRAERQRLLDAVARDGFATGYSGLRISKSGRRFLIEDGLLWELRDAHGVLQGVAATFDRWRNVAG